MQRRDLGDTGLRVPALGFGAGVIGGPELTERQVGALLGGALDLGISLIDTAPSYGESEQRIGRHLAHRRADFILCTKVGYGVPGVPDWTAESVRLGVDRALERLQTDHLDVVTLHSCPREVLERGEVLDALRQATEAGKVRAMGYSGDGPGLERALDDGRVRVVMASLNPVDQALLAGPLDRAKDRAVGVLAKRPLANAVWVDAAPPARPDRLEYWRRWQALGADLGADPAATCVRFAAFTWGVDCAVVGTRHLRRLESLAAAVALGPLPPTTRQELLGAARHRGWPGLI